MSREDPRLGLETIARVCNRRPPGHGKDSKEICGKDARFHVFWDMESLQNSFVCMDHAREATQHFDAQTWHGVGPCCGMPGTWYSVAENVCRCDEGLSAQVELQEAVNV